jgi:hypothetical protein
VTYPREVIPILDAVVNTLSRELRAEAAAEEHPGADASQVHAIGGCRSSSRASVAHKRMANRPGQRTARHMYNSLLTSQYDGNQQA